MDLGMFPDDGVNSWNTVMLLYESAIKKLRTKVEILNDEFQQVHQYNPIEYIKTRVKTPESIVKKLKKNGYEISIPNMIEHCNDIAGVRIVCSFTSDIYQIAEMIGRQTDVTVVSIKDYIKNPKPSGYRSYHLILAVKTERRDVNGNVPGTFFVEIQIRTIAMDTWAALEHKLKYKKDIPNQELLVAELKRVADELASCDLSMQTIREIIS